MDIKSWVPSSQFNTNEFASLSYHTKTNTSDLRLTKACE